MQTVGTVVLRVQQDGVERRITVDELESGIQTGDVGAETPVWFDGRWAAAREWPNWEALRASPEAAVRRLWTRRPVAWVTAITLGVLVQVHIWVRLLAGRGSLEWAEAITRDTTGILERGEGWRLLTYGLLHANIAHILGNAGALVVAGMGLETLIGRRATLLVLLVTTALGGTLSAVLMPEIASVGISGGDFGLLGATAILGARYGSHIPGNARVAFGTVAALYTVYIFITSAFDPSVDTPCHLGGLLAGLVVGALYRPRIPVWERHNRRVDIGLAALLAVLLLVPIAAGPKLVPWVDWKADGATATRPSWWSYQVSRSGLGGYGNADQSSAISLATTRHARRPVLAEVFAERLEVVRRADPDAILEPLGDDGAQIRYRIDEVDRVVELRGVVRGLYVTVAAIDTREGARMAPELRRHILDERVLAPPDAAVRALEGATSAAWKAKLGAAVALAELGDLAGAAPLFAAARAEGDSSAVEAAELGVLAALQDPTAPARLEAALAGHPEDRRLRSAVARGWSLLGDTDRAIRVALTLWADAPSDRSRRAAEELIEEVGGTVPTPPPVVVPD